MGSPRSAWALAVAGLVAAATGWLVTDHLERSNDFCTACHREPGIPLHIEIRRDFDAPVAASLAGAHASARVEGRDDPRFRCIDCHGGTSLLGRARVKALAAKDGFWYAVGRYEEPTEMRWPLWDEDCRKCHAMFSERAPEPWETPAFHELAVHNADPTVACVECHHTHGGGGNPDAFFVHPAPVRSLCARCHPEFEEGEG